MLLIFMWLQSFPKRIRTHYRKIWIGCRLVKFRFGRFQMRIISTHILLICFDLVVFCAVGADYRYQQCVPSSCGGRNSPNISFPFYVWGKRQPYCGYQRFNRVNCVNELPIINLLGNQYVIEDIQYESKSLRLRVYAAVAAAASISGDGVCYSRLNNRTEAWGDFELADNVTMLHLFSNCSDSLPENHFKNGSVCEGINDESDENYRLALRNCLGHVTVPVERQAAMDTGRTLRNGFVVKWIASDCTECSDSHGRCGFNETTHLFKCFCPDRPHSRSCKPENNRATVVLVSAASGGGLFILVSLLVSLIIWRRKQRSNRAYLLSRTISKTDLEGGSTYYGIPIFSYTELKVATDDFDSSNELGDGGFGTVYYGNLKDGREVAVKRLYEHNNRRMEQYLNEIKILTCLRHPHLVSLYGCTSRRSQELILVYEYISNGTVADHLHGMRAKDAPLSWEVRMKIALETADALAYLHKSDIIHRDVKTDNILLDKNFCVKVADFGLSRLFPSAATHVSTAPQGTPGYVDPEYHQFYQLTDKSDVYSFGVVLIELVSSMPAVDISRHRHEINLANLAMNKIQMRAFDDLIDASLGHKTNEEVRRMTTSVAELAFQCLQLEKDMRPSMDEVLSTLIVIDCSNKPTVELVKQGSGSRSMSEMTAAASPETTDDMMLLRGKKFQSSPNAVTDVWVSGSTVSGSVSGFGEIIKQENL